MNALPVVWVSVSSARPINFSTSSGVMPIRSLANLLLGAGVPTISPSIVPSLDLTIRPFGVDAVEAGADFEADEVLVVSAACCVAQPTRKTRQMASINRCIMRSPKEAWWSERLHKYKETATECYFCMRENPVNILRQYFFRCNKSCFIHIYTTGAKTNAHLIVPLIFLSGLSVKSALSTTFWSPVQSTVRKIICAIARYSSDAWLLRPVVQ